MFWCLYRQNFPSMGTGELVDAASLEWEAELRDLLLQQRFTFPFVFLRTGKGFMNIFCLDI